MLCSKPHSALPSRYLALGYRRYDLAFSIIRNELKSSYRRVPALDTGIYLSNVQMVGMFLGSTVMGNSGATKKGKVFALFSQIILYSPAEYRKMGSYNGEQQCDLRFGYIWIWRWELGAHHACIEPILSAELRDVWDGDTSIGAVRMVIAQAFDGKRFWIAARRDRLFILRIGKARTGDV